MEEGIPERVAQLLDMFDGREEAAQVAGVSTTQLRRWMAGTAEKAGLASIRRLCEAKDISLDWLSTGEGPMRRSEREEALVAMATGPQTTEEFLDRSAAATKRLSQLIDSKTKETLGEKALYAIRDLMVVGAVPDRAITNLAEAVATEIERVEAQTYKSVLDSVKKKPEDYGLKHDPDAEWI